MSRLDPTVLTRLPPDIARPSFDRAALQSGIVHLGIGAFARAHLAAATEAAIAREGDRRWGIVGVSLRQPDTRDALAGQEGLYTLALRDADATGQPRQRLQVIGCLQRVLVAPESPAAVLEAIAHPATRILSLTVTEKGYLRDPQDGALWTAHPDVAHDLAHPSAPRTAVGFIVRGLALRMQRGLAPLTLMSLDNLPANGRTLRTLVMDLADRACPDAARWIEQHCTFPCSMVDRIVPKTQPADREQVAAALGAHDAWPVMAEPFLDWAVEDHFAAGRPDWSAGGARFVAEAAPWETLKLRVVNGSHSAIAYLGAMAGWATVDSAIAQPAMHRFVETLLREEVEPTLPGLPGLEVTRYRQSLLQRLANPALAHRTLQIAMDGSQKLPQRLLGTARERLMRGQSAARLALAVAAWLHFLRGHDEQGRALPLDDPLREALLGLRERAASRPTSAEEVATLLDFGPVFASLGKDPAIRGAFAGELTRALQALRTRGVAATLDAWA